MNARLALSKNCSFGVSTTIELNNVKNISDNNGIQRGVFRIRSVPVLSDLFIIFLRSIVILTPNGNF